MQPSLAKAQPPRSEALTLRFDLICIHQNFTQTNDI
jgi:hypothetical protein